MLLLIRTDRHKIRLIKQDIRRHEHRIGKQADIHIIRMLG